MNIDELKQLVKHSTAVLVLDNGEPSFAILNYDTYKNLVLKDGNVDKEKEVKVHHSATVGNGVGNSRNSDGVNSRHDQPEMSQGELEILERINKDILALKAEIEREEKTVGMTVDHK